MSILRHAILLNQTNAGTGPWVQLSDRCGSSDRGFQVFVTSGDSVTIQATTVDQLGINKDFLDTLPTEDIVDLKVYTASEADTLEGAWAFIRAVKTGSNGLAKVQATL